jgi:hypothetical protein
MAGEDRGTAREGFKEIKPDSIQMGMTGADRQAEAEKLADELPLYNSFCSIRTLNISKLHHLTIGQKSSPVQFSCTSQVLHAHKGHTRQRCTHGGGGIHHSTVEPLGPPLVTLGVDRSSPSQR